MKNIYNYEKPSVFGTVIQLSGLAAMFGGMIIGNWIFGNLIVGLLGGLIAFMIGVSVFVKKSRDLGRVDSYRIPQQQVEP